MDIWLQDKENIGTKHATTTKKVNRSKMKIDIGTTTSIEIIMK